MITLLVGTEKGLYRLFLEDSSPSAVELLAFEDLEVDPLVHDSQDSWRVYAAIEGDGLWQSADAGRTWTKRWQPPAGSILYTIATHPTRAGVLYAGLEPAAVWISRDAGQNWEELTGLQEVPDREEWRFFAPRQAHVRALMIEPGRPERIYVGIEEGGVYVSEDGGLSFDSRNGGLYRDIHCIIGFPDNASQLATTGDGLYRSEDRGRRWSHITNGLTRSYTVPLLVAGHSTQVLFVAAASAPPPSWNQGSRGADAKVFRSWDRGLTWEDSSKGFALPQRGMIFCLAADPLNPARLFAGTTDGKIYLSEVEGSTWQVLAEGLPAVYSLLPLR